MKHEMIITIRSIFLMFFCFWLLPSVAGAETRRHACGSHHGQTLQRAIDRLDAGDTLIVSGTCNENVLIRNEKQRITIDGAGAGAGTRAAVIAAPGSDDRRTRRSEFPSVVPYPAGSGSQTNRAWRSSPSRRSIFGYSSSTMDMVPSLPGAGAPARTLTVSSVRR